jgi:transcriptional regulator with XRE-family HTH domain
LVIFFADTDNMEISGKAITERIDSVLKEKNLKRKAVADAVGISLQPFTSWTNRGSIPAADTAIKIARFLGVSVEWLVTGEDPQGLSQESRALLADWNDIEDGSVKRLLRQNIASCATEARSAKNKAVAAE